MTYALPMRPVARIALAFLNTRHPSRTPGADNELVNADG